MVARGGSPLARGGSPLGRRASRLAPPRVAARHRRARLCIPPPPAAWCADCGSSAIPLSHRHGARALLKRRDGDIAPYRHYAREVRTAITSAKYAPPLSRVAPAPTGATCEKGGHPLGCPPGSFIGNHARSITNGECRLLCTMPHDTPRRPQAVRAQRHPSSPQAPRPWQPSAGACRQRAWE